MKKKIGIVGGGAAGLFAAITCAWQGAEVTILEGNDRVGKKILSTGNGKCNLGNMILSKEAYYSRDIDRVEAVLKAFDQWDTISFFQKIGLLLREKNGYLYPACEQASVVLDALRFELNTLGVQVITNVKIREIGKQGEGIFVSTGENSHRYFFDSVILACGGRAATQTGSDGSGYKLAKKLGHSLVPTVPALVKLECREDYFKAAAGVRADAELSLLHKGEVVAKERGELQFTETGVSGIPVFQLSRVANYLLREQEEVVLQINLLPDFSDEEYSNICMVRELLQEGRTVEEFFNGFLHKKLVALFLRISGLKPTTKMREADREKIKIFYELCRDFCVHISGSNSFEQAQVCAGGIPLSEVTPSMESMKCKNLFFAGEILDVDGKCGGYNLQWAWSSGYLAAMGATRAEEQKI